MTVNWKKVLIGLVVVVALAILALYMTVPRSWGHDVDPRVTKWETTPMPREDLGQFEPTANTTVDRVPPRLRVKQYKTFTRTRQQLRVSPAVERSLCGARGGSITKAWVRIIGGNVMIPDVVSANMTWTWCYWRGEIRGVRDPNTWGDGRLLYVWDGVTDKVKGGGTNVHGVDYRYARYYFRWARPAVSSLPGMSATAWIAMTVRGDGTCTADKYQQDGTERC